MTPDILWLAKITVYDKIALATKVLLFTTAPGFTTKATDTPAKTEVRSVVMQPARLQRNIVDKGRLTGRSQIGFGDLVLGNTDGALDDFARYAVDGRECVIYFANTMGAIPADWQIAFNGTMEQAVYSDKEVRLLLRATEYFASQPLQPNKYAGDNEGSEGLEGYGGDLRNKPKILAFGAPLNVTLLNVNPAKLIWQGSDGGLRDFVAVYAGGGLLTPGADYADSTELQDNSLEPDPLFYRKDKAGGYIRLGTSPRELITADLFAGETMYDLRAASIIRNLVVDRGGVDPSLLSAADLAALNPATLGFTRTEETDIADPLDEVTRSIGAAWFSDNTGVLRVKTIEAPSGDPVAEFSDNIISIERQRFDDKDAGLPIWKVNVCGIRLHTVQTQGVIPQVTPQRRARLAQEWVTVSAEDPAVKTAHLKAEILTVYTALQCEAAMQAEANRLLALMKVRRNRYEVRVKADYDLIRAVDLCTVVRLKRNRYGMNDGVLGLVLGLEPDPAKGRLSATVWA